MLCLWSSQTFWKSRFWPSNERGFLNYLLQKPGNEQAKAIADWRLVYRNTFELHCDPQFDEMIRLWELSRWLRDAVSSFNHEGGKYPKEPLPEFAGRALQHYHGTHWHGMDIQRASISSSLVKLGLWVIREPGNPARITGLQFINADGTSVTLGRRTSGAVVAMEETQSQRIPVAHGNMERVLKSHAATTVILEAKSLRGFDAVPAPGGNVAELSIYRGTGHSGNLGYGGGPDGIFTLVMDNLTEVIATFNVSSFSLIT